MSFPNQNAPRMRRHKRRINDDGSQLAHAVRAFVDSQQPIDEQSLYARQADGANGIGPGRGANAPPMGGGFGGGTTDTDTETDAATPTTTRGSGNGNGVNRPTATATTTTPSRNLFPTTTAAVTTSSSSPDFLGGLLSTIFDDTTSSSSTRSTSTSTSTSSSTSSSSSSTSSSTRSSSTSSSSSSVSSPSQSPSSTTQQPDAQETSNPNNSDDDDQNENDTSSSRTSITPITATAVVTSTPTASLVASTPSSTPKSTTSSAGPIIGIVAGSLVGIVVLSGLVGFLFKKYRNKEDPYEANPFDRDAFQRHSAMIPDHFDSDEGHGGAGAGGMSPEMSEHYQQYNNYAPHYESGISAGAAGAAAGMAYNENGGPRPPTMFAKHAAGVQQNSGPQVGGYYKDGEYSMPAQDYHAPPSAAFVNHHEQSYLDEPGFGQGQRSISPVPQLPPLAAFGGDPYSIAGVGRGQQQNVANPYAHLDRSLPPQSQGGFTPGAIVPHHTAGSNSVSSGSADSADQRHASISAAEALAAGLAHQSSLNRSASPQPPTGGYDTAGRPGTSEGRSGTPDIPNPQQTYAPGQQQHSNPFEDQHYHQQAQQQGLQVRNLVPNGGLSAGQRPISSASSIADPEDAYGGVY